MVNGVLSRKVEITLNSAVSLVQTLQPLLFIPCYKSGGGSSRHLDGEVASLSERCLLEELLTSPPLAYNTKIGDGAVSPIGCYRIVARNE